MSCEIVGLVQALSGLRQISLAMQFLTCICVLMGLLLQVVEAPNGQAEAEWIAARIRRLASEGGDLRQIAVLFRIHKLSRVIEQALVRSRSSSVCGLMETALRQPPGAAQLMLLQRCRQSCTWFIGWLSHECLHCQSVQVKEGIPFVVLGGTPFWRRTEVSPPSVYQSTALRVRPSNSHSSCSPFDCRCATSPLSHGDL